MTPRSQCKDEAEYLECLRDDFAAAVIQGLAVGHATFDGNEKETRARFALAAYATADAMLAQRSK